MNYLKLKFNQMLFTTNFSIKTYYEISKLPLQIFECFSLQIFLFQNYKSNILLTT